MTADFSAALSKAETWKNFWCEFLRFIGYLCQLITGAGRSGIAKKKQGKKKQSHLTPLCYMVTNILRGFTLSLIVE